MLNPSPNRRAQLAVYAAAERDFLKVWPLLDLGRLRETWPVFTRATLLLVRKYGRMSAGLAAAFYRSGRLSAGVPGSPPPIRTTPTDEEILNGLWAMGPENAKKLLLSGRPLAEVEATTLVNLQGVATKYVLDHGRDVVLNAVKDDPRARGWSREAGATACEFCTMLASRGAVYGSEEAASFPSHRHCGCTATPAW